MKISIVIPVYEEEKNIKPLYNKITNTVDNNISNDYEIIFVDDGSKDETFRELWKIREHDKQLKVIRFRRNFGQTAAMDAGFKKAGGDVIITMDGDLQNDPEDIPLLLNKLEEGYDVVSGWRKDRKDGLGKHVVSRVANTLRKILFNDEIHDSGCSLKAYKKECVEGLNLYGEMHRFIPLILEHKGFKIGEVVVKHHPRIYGKTKYGLARTLKGFLDMIVVKFWMRYAVRPMHVFGTIGLVSSVLGGLTMVWLTYIKIFLHGAIGNKPLLPLSILLVLIGVLFIIFGLVADILVKLYYQDNLSYNIKEVIG